MLSNAIEFAMNNAWLIPALPLLAFVIIVFLTYRSPKLSAFVGIVCILSSFTLAILIGAGVLGHGGEDLVKDPIIKTWSWFKIQGFELSMGFRVDGVSAMLLFVVTLVASMVQIYSLGYMHGDPSFSRFYAYLSLFAMSMLGLTIAPTLLQMFIFWELVGLCSYLLIGFWFFKYSAREAAKKAFITTRTGDFGLLLGLLLLQWKFGTLELTLLQERIAHFADFGVTAAGLFGIAVLLFIGPIGKSGQFPLHVWLPDAMEGPTPVSALIHAATMVVAGVYLTGRSLFLFESAGALEVVAWVGGFTAFFAATIALTQREMKRVLAYSTVSQLGYMMLALGAASMTASYFHLMTHAFFKALMFLGAGSVLHAMHGKTDIFEFGGLTKKMPVTTWTFLIGCIAIAGIPPFAGFWSKDEILLSVYEKAVHGSGSYWILLILAMLTAGMTAFYMFRLFYVSFTGKGNPENHPHESPISMLIPLIVLATLSVVGGLVGAAALGIHRFQEVVAPFWAEHPHIPEANYPLMIAATLIALVGIAIATWIYLFKKVSNEAIANTFKPIYTLLYNKYYIDEIYLWFIHNVIDGLGKVLYWFDIYVVDGIVNGVAGLVRFLGGTIRYIQTGKLQNYALVLFAAVVVIVIILALNGDIAIAAGGVK